MRPRLVQPLCLALALFGASCSHHISFSSGIGPRYTGSGDFGTLARELPSFRHIESLGSIDVVARVGESRSLEITGDDNLLQHVITEVENGRLTVSLENGSYEMNRPMTVTVSTPELESLEIRGSGDAHITGLERGSLELSVLGSGDVDAQGQVDRLEATIRGSGDMELRELRARAAEISVMGSGDLTVFAEERLSATVHGSGDIDVWGSPADREIVVHGSGSVTEH